MRSEINSKKRRGEANLNGCNGSRNQIVDVAFEVVELIVELLRSFTYKELNHRKKRKVVG